VCVCLFVAPLVSAGTAGTLPPGRPATLTGGGTAQAKCELRGAARRLRGDCGEIGILKRRRRGPHRIQQHFARKQGRRAESAAPPRRVYLASCRARCRARKGRETLSYVSNGNVTPKGGRMSVGMWSTGVTPVGACRFGTSVALNFGTHFSRCAARRGAMAAQRGNRNLGAILKMLADRRHCICGGFALFERGAARSSMVLRGVPILLRMSR